MADYAFRLKEQLVYVNEHSFNNFQIRAGTLPQHIWLCGLLVCLFKSHTVWLGWICLRCDRLAGPCMRLCMVVFLLHVVLHGAVGGGVVGGNLFYL